MTDSATMLAHEEINKIHPAEEDFYNDYNDTEEDEIRMIYEWVLR